MATFNSNRDEVDKRMEKAMEQSLRLVGGLAERKAKETISDMDAVDTGFLRNSITFALDGDSPNIDTYHDDPNTQKGSYEGRAPEEGNSKRSVYIGTNIFYAPYVEFGTRHMVARPFLENSIQDGEDEFRRLFEDAFQHYFG